MSSSPHDDTTAADECAALLKLALLALAVGAMTGVAGAVFRIALERADRLRDAVIAWAHPHALGGFLVVVLACAIAPAIAAWLVRRFSPHASGSGIPHVEAVLEGQIPPAPFGLVPVKFFGGLLAIGSGLALGREGPSVQIGAGIAYFTSRMCRCNWPDCRVLLAAGAGNRRIERRGKARAGAVFVLEELVRRFEHRIAIAALAASATSIAVGRLFLGDMPDFTVGPISPVGAEARALFFALGAMAGILAVAYNRTLLATLAAAERLAAVPVELRAALIGGAVGVLAWFAPELVGGGDNITQSALTGHDALTFVVVAFLIRFALGPLSYASATPGGLFAPLLVIGAQSGLLFGAACQFLFPDLGVPREAYALVGMAAFFTGVVRAPVTGIVLVTEMTANVSLLLPMLGAAFVAMLVPTLLRDAPIYDSLRELTLRKEQAMQQIGQQKLRREKEKDERRAST